MTLCGVRLRRFGCSSYLQRRHNPGVVRWPKTRGRKVFRLVSDQLGSERPNHSDREYEIDPLVRHSEGCERVFALERPCEATHAWMDARPRVLETFAHQQLVRSVLVRV